jgi:hypothetical protein
MRASRLFRLSIATIAIVDLSACRSIEEPLSVPREAVAVQGPTHGVTELAFTANPYFGHVVSLESRPEGDSIVVAARFDGAPEPIDMLHVSREPWNVTLYLSDQPWSRPLKFPFLLIDRGVVQGENGNLFAGFLRWDPYSDTFVTFATFRQRGPLLTWRFHKRWFATGGVPPITPNPAWITIRADGAGGEIGLWMAPYSKHEAVAVIDR